MLKIDSDLLSAVLQGEVNDVARTLAEGANPNSLDPAGWSSLMWAAGQGDTDKLIALIESGANPFLCDSDGRTAYAIAAAAGRLDAMALLAGMESKLDPTSAMSSSRRHESRAYCRAYPARLLRGFAGWCDPDTDGKTEPPIESDTLLFVHRSLQVTRSVFEDGDLVFQGDIPGWAEFCRDELDFRPIDDRDWAAVMNRFDERLDSGRI